MDKIIKKIRSAVKVSVCVTTFNEKKETIQKLLDALNKQTLRPDEIIIIDANDYNNCSRSKGRNIAIKKAKNEIIAITDAGCVPQRDWIENIAKPYNKVHLGGVLNVVVAGLYKMIARNNFEKAESVFLGVNAQEINHDYMPSARSMAFTKTIWEKAGGFPEELKDTAEDTVFNLKLINAGAKFVVAKKARVDWEMPKSIKDFYLKIKNYAYGDAQSGIWWHPVKKWSTHNLKVLTIFLRYLLFMFVLLGFGYLYLFVFICIYSLWAFKKAGIWGIPLQFVSDFACIIGFSHGIFSKCFKRY